MAAKTWVQLQFCIISWFLAQCTTSWLFHPTHSPVLCVWCKPYVCCGQFLWTHSSVLNPNKLTQITGIRFWKSGWGVTCYVMLTWDWSAIQARHEIRTLLQLHLIVCTAFTNAHETHANGWRPKDAQNGAACGAHEYSNCENLIWSYGFTNVPLILKCLGLITSWN